MGRRRQTFREVLPTATCDAFALAFRYPQPGAAGLLLDTVEAVPSGSPRRAFARHVTAVTAMPEVVWEELYTRTLDLSPLVAPYVGFAVWGETYQRGAFLADLMGAQRAAGIDPKGELPDHLDPVLRYLAEADDPLESVIGALPVAASRLHQTLRSIEQDNPYVALLDALRQVTAPLSELVPPPHRGPGETAASLPLLGG